MSAGSTYIEEEAAVKHFAGLLSRGVGQVDIQLIVGDASLVQSDCVELLVTGHVDGGQIPVGDESLAPTEGVTHELHGAFVVRGQVQLAFDAQDNVEVLFRFDEVAQIRG